MQRVNLNDCGLFSFRTGNGSRAPVFGERPNKPTYTAPESYSYRYYGYQ